MFSGFFGGIFAFFCTSIIAIGGVVGIYNVHQSSRKKKELDRNIVEFIQLHHLQECEPGFYHGAEKEAASQFGITENEAYRLISIQLSNLK